MIDMIDLVQAEQACQIAEKVLGMKPFAEGSDKFKQSSQDTYEITTKQESDAVIGVVT